MSERKPLFGSRLSTTPAANTNSRFSYEVLLNLNEAWKYLFGKILVIWCFIEVSKVEKIAVWDRNFLSAFESFLSLPPSPGGGGERTTIRCVSVIFLDVSKKLLFHLSTRTQSDLNF